MTHDDTPIETSEAPAGWEGAEEWMPLAWELCAEEHGEEACSELRWEGGPIPEPWGERWLKYEDEAKRLIALVRKCAALVASQPASIETSEDDARLIARARDLLSRAYGHTTASDDLLPEQIKRWLVDSEAASQPATAPVVPAGWSFALDTDGSATVVTSGGSCARIWEHGGGGIEWLAYKMAAMLAAAPAAPVVQTLTDKDLLKCVREIVPGSTLRLTREVGPYDITEPTPLFRLLADALLRAATQAAPVVPQPAEKQPAAQQGEAVAWAWRHPDGEIDSLYVRRDDCERDAIGYEGKSIPLYTTPPARQAVALTEEQIDKLLESERMRWSARSGPPTYEFSSAFARAIERAVWQINGITPAGGENSNG